MTALIDAVQDERDRKLVERHQAGDRTAFAELYARHYGRLIRYCRRLVRDSHMAEEIAQDAFLRAYTSLDRLDGDRRFYPWVTVIARHLAIDHARRHGRVQPQSDVDAGHTGAAEDVVVQRFEGDQVRTALQRVRARHREVLHLRDWEGLSYDTIAERLGVTPTAVPPLLHRARAALRREYLLVTEGRVAAILHVGALTGFVRRSRDRLAMWTSWLPDMSAMSAPVVGAFLSMGVIFSPSVATPVSAQHVPDVPLVMSLGWTAAEDAGDAGLNAPPSYADTAAPSAPRRGGHLDPAPSEHIVVPDVASVTINDRERTQRSRAEQRDHPIYFEAGPVGIASDPEEDKRHYEQMLADTLG